LHTLETIKRSSKNELTAARDVAIATVASYSMKMSLLTWIYRLIYPGHSESQQEEVVRLSTKLKTLIEFTFETTNNLIDMLNDNSGHIPPLVHVNLDHTVTVRANLENLIAKMAEIQNVVEKVDKMLGSKLDPGIYRQLKLPDISIKERITLAKKTASAPLGIAVSVEGIVIISAIKSGIILTRIGNAIAVMKSCLIASVVLGMLAMDCNIIASAIIGSVERNNLENAIDHLEKVMEGFEPASKEYSKTFMAVQVQLEILLGEDLP